MTGNYHKFRPLTKSACKFGNVRSFFNITRPVSWLWELELFVHFCGFVCLTLKSRKGILTGMKFRGRKFYTLLALNQQQIKGSIKRRWSSIKILFIYLGTWVRYANVSPSLLTLKSSVFPAGIVKILRPWRSLPPVIRSTQIKAVNLIHLKHKQRILCNQT